MSTINAHSDENHLRPDNRWDVEPVTPNRLFSLEGKVATVTGAGGGVGSWLAVGLAAAGAKLVLSDIDRQKCAQLGDFLSSAGTDFIVVPADLRTVSAPAEIVGGTVEHFGRLDVMVNVAAVNERRPIATVEPDSWSEIASINLRAAYFLAREAMLAMRANGGGSIINITSVNSEIGLEDVSVYGAHKAALAQVTKTMCVEWAKYNIRVNCIAPGFLMTSLSRPLWLDDDRARWILDRCPMRRPGVPSELIGACLLLASAAGSFISGSSVLVDGGLLAGSPWKA
ncbi:2-dehydro-3-deoxy-D-gluconate 5-dehydrogenase [Nonomuraea coxensis DSM 45129]|uniref:2-dehydro-3-deoxy-D-gluconate 5-dehydrogenase n=1 Tax=Nonomuraea coxensis DSM 45129 TaxID=1122611 RepID=A0ABX8UBS7_9ACTN|nr:SDR family oxidoreductase [Nonomuraea coxensis]QYC45214.1 2-dehydro-3-deoxy-D-gluconate 5-dehydrogenase [Nonomuraea coxensis DSM 45129]